MLEDTSGIVQRYRGDRFKVTEVLVTTEDGGRRIGRKPGRYLTLESPDVGKPTDAIDSLARELSHELEAFIPDGSVLVVGLGNESVTPDTLGVLTAKGVVATRHFREEFPDDEYLTSLREVSVLTAGVLGQTGIESSEVVRSIVETVRPECVLVVDALA
jgi:spore protease